MLLLTKLYLLISGLFVLIPFLFLIAVYSNQIIISDFNKIVVTVSCILFVLLILVIYYKITKFKAKNKNDDKTWPPVVSNCPDYWEDNGHNGSDCVNVKNLGTCPAQQGKTQLHMDFTTSDYTGSMGTCNKYNWANNCNIFWEGVNYGTSNPCTI
jgi:hypothetical protein